MSDVAFRELRNNTGALLDRVGNGESITITVDGRPVAVLQPVPERPVWLSRDVFTAAVLRHQSDPGLTADLIALTT